MHCEDASANARKWYTDSDISLAKRIIAFSGCCSCGGRRRHVFVMRFRIRGS